MPLLNGLKFPINSFIITTALSMVLRNILKRYLIKATATSIAGGIGIALGVIDVVKGVR